MTDATPVSSPRRSRSGYRVPRRTSRPAPPGPDTPRRSGRTGRHRNPRSREPGCATRRRRPDQAQRPSANPTRDPAHSRGPALGFAALTEVAIRSAACHSCGRSWPAQPRRSTSSKPSANAALEHRRVGNGRLVEGDADPAGARCRTAARTSPPRRAPAPNENMPSTAAPAKEGPVQPFQRRALSLARVGSWIRRAHSADANDLVAAGRAEPATGRPRCWPASSRDPAVLLAEISPPAGPSSTCRRSNVRLCETGLPRRSGGRRHVLVRAGARRGGDVRAAVLQRHLRDRRHPRDEAAIPTRRCSSAAWQRASTRCCASVSRPGASAGVASG